MPGVCDHRCARFQDSRDASSTVGWLKRSLRTERSSGLGKKRPPRSMRSPRPAHGSVFDDLAGAALESSVSAGDDAAGARALPDSATIYRELNQRAGHDSSCRGR